MGVYMNLKEYKLFEEDSLINIPNLLQLIIISYYLRLIAIITCKSFANWRTSALKLNGFNFVSYLHILDSVKEIENWVKLSI
jgi:hypothetical protein